MIRAWSVAILVVITVTAAATFAAHAEAGRPDASVRDRAEELARAASEEFDKVLRPEPGEGARTSPAPASSEAVSSGGLVQPVLAWLERASSLYRTEITPRLAAAPGDGVTVAAVLRNWLERANRTYHEQIVARLAAPRDDVPAATSGADAPVTTPSARMADAGARPDLGAGHDEARRMELRRLAELRAAEQRRAEEDAERLARAKAAVEKRIAEDEARAAEAAKRQGEAARRVADAKAAAEKKIADDAAAEARAAIAREAEKKAAAEGEAARIEAERFAAAKAAVERKLAEEVAVEAKRAPEPDASATKPPAVPLRPGQTPAPSAFGASVLGASAPPPREEKRPEPERRTAQAPTPARVAAAPPQPPAAARSTVRTSQRSADAKPARRISRKRVVTREEVRVRTVRRVAKAEKSRRPVACRAVVHRGPNGRPIRVPLCGCR